MAKYIFIENGQVIASTNNEIEDFWQWEVKGFLSENFDAEKIALKYDIFVDKNWNITYLEWEEFLKNQEAIKSSKIVLIKDKYSKIILEKYSLTDQLNMSNEALQIIAFAQFEKRDFTEAETLKLLEIQTAKDFIDNQRGLCNKEIENLI